MPQRVNPKRPYESPRRREQAASTRAQILEAAQRLFEAKGYVATTMAAVAREAGVSLKTVYLAFDTKGGLLRAVWDTLLRGAPDIPVADQPWYREVMDEPDPARQLALTARNSRDVKQRIGGLLRVIRDAAPVDADAHALWTLIESDFYANQRAIVETLRARKALRRGIDVTRATDILWTLNHPDVWHLLVDERGWTPEQWERWFADTGRAQLLR
jgi:AcrR family transcriptional regulator